MSKKKKQHITLDPVRNARYLRRHRDELDKIPNKTAARRGNEVFLDKRHSQR